MQNTLAGIRAVTRDYAEVGALFRFSRWQGLHKLVLPAAAPPIFTGLQQIAILAWIPLTSI